MKIKLANAEESLAEGQWSDAIYYSYSSIVNTAKALLTGEGKKTNTHNKIISDFNEVFVASNKIELGSDFEAFIYQINQNEPSEAFAKHYLAEADKFFNLVEEFRASELVEA